MKLIVAVALVVMVFAAPNDKKDNANKRFLGQGGFGQGHGHGGGGGFGGGHHGGGGGFGGGHHGGGGGFGGGHHGGGTSKCRYWCKNRRGQFYCCENNNQQPGPVGHKRGRCPPVRPVCPQGVRFGPPQTCSNDYSCNGADKCCFDSCLEQHVCKQPIRGGFNPGVGVGIGGGGGLGGLGGILGGILGGGGHNVGGHHNVGGFARKKP